MDRQALVVGAGIGGLCAALFLARKGWRVTLAERDDPPREAGAGLQLSPNATLLVDRLNLMPAILASAVKPKSLLIRAATGSELAQTPLGEFAETRFGAPFLVVHRGAFHAILRQAAEANSAIQLLAGHRLIELRETASTATGLFETAHGETRLEAALLVGADGVWSRVRPLIGLPQPSIPARKTAWRTLLPAHDVPGFARRLQVNLWLGRNAHLVHYPVNGGRDINVVAIIDEDWRSEGWSEPGEPTSLNKRFDEWHGDARALVGASRVWTRWALVDRAPEHRWSRQRITLLGDAAHPMMPFLAQGASQAIEDAACLAHSLGEARTDASLSSQLAHYDRARLARTARIQGLAREQGTIYHLGGPLAVARNLALQLLPGRSLLERHAWIYAHDAEA
ncbi:UbiH 2-polyprenyl-6-methoxyphenol hydroxylase and related FAD-dependent oxidoreductases [Rhabdaerophilaceae bacterium]